MVRDNTAEPDPVTGQDGAFFEWLALRRVHDGEVTAVDTGYVQYGRPIIGAVANALGRLIEGGYLALGSPDPRGHRTVCVTVAGQTRYAEFQARVAEADRPDRSDVAGDIPAPAVTRPTGNDDGHLAVLFRQVQWALDDAAHDWPAGRATPQKREELAGALDSLATIVRASIPVEVIIDPKP